MKPMKALCLSLALLAITACTGENKSPYASKNADGTEKEVLSYNDFNANLYKMNNLVCDPLNTGSNIGLGDGLKAELYYTNNVPYFAVNDYYSNGVKSEKHLFFSELNVPTRMWTLGFPTETGGIIQDDLGNNLHEFFALKFTTVIQLSEDLEEGWYQLALMSDDGANWKIRNSEGEYERIVDNDGTHPTRMGCSNGAIHIGAAEELVTIFDYYQGPRQHIGMVPMWRKVDSQDAAQDPYCGMQGNPLFWDYKNNSEPTQMYRDLKARGWNELTAANFNLPAEHVFNPCANGEVPTISNFLVKDLFDGLIRVRFETDIEASAQVRIVDMVTGEETITDSDNVLRTTHNLPVYSFTPGREYAIQGIAISQSFGKALSPIVTIVPK